MNVLNEMVDRFLLERSHYKAQKIPTDINLNQSDIRHSLSRLFDRIFEEDFVATTDVSSVFIVLESIVQLKWRTVFELFLNRIRSMSTLSLPVRKWIDLFFCEFSKIDRFSDVLKDFIQDPMVEGLIVSEVTDDILDFPIIVGRVILMDDLPIVNLVSKIIFWNLVKYSLLTFSNLEIIGKIIKRGSSTHRCLYYLLSRGISLCELQSIIDDADHSLMNDYFINSLLHGDEYWLQTSSSSLELSVSYLHNELEDILYESAKCWKESVRTKQKYHGQKACFYARVICAILGVIKGTISNETVLPIIEGLSSAIEDMNKKVKHSAMIIGELVTRRRKNEENPLNFGNAIIYDGWTLELLRLAKVDPPSDPETTQIDSDDYEDEDDYPLVRECYGKGLNVKNAKDQIYSITSDLDQFIGNQLNNSKDHDKLESLVDITVLRPRESVPIVLHRCFGSNTTSSTMLSGLFVLSESARRLANTKPRQKSDSCSIEYSEYGKMDAIVRYILEPVFNQGNETKRNGSLVENRFVALAESVFFTPLLAQFEKREYGSLLPSNNVSVAVVCTLGLFCSLASNTTMADRLLACICHIKCSTLRNACLQSVTGKELPDRFIKIGN
ncbi:hypothetical protein ACOME3_006987 [Neoechinorhynchus agilis]